MRRWRKRVYAWRVHPGRGQGRTTSEMTGDASVALPLESATFRSGAVCPDEEQVRINRCLAGDPEAFRPLVQRYQRVTFSVALRMLGSRADAEDVAQQAFADAYAALDRFHGEGRSRAFYTWVLRITINRAKDVLKSKKRTEEPLGADTEGNQAMFAHDPGNPEEHAGQAEDRRRLQAALLTLPPKYREVLVLKDVEGLAYEEIGPILRLPLTTLKIRVIRARARMRTALQEARR